MAGIGFVLRKLARHDDLSGPMLALMHSTVIATGPWLLTILTTNLVIHLSELHVASDDIQLFRLLIVYNFAFALLIGSPVNIIITRYISDLIHAKDLRAVPGVLVGGLALLSFVSLPLLIGVYMCVFDLPVDIALCAFADYLLIAVIWLAAVFLCAVKDYSTVTIAYFAGVVAVSFGSSFLARQLGIVGALTAFGLGFSLILAVLLAKILAEYPAKLERPFAFMGHFVKYWDLALSALFFAAGIWVDKWIMWFAPEAEISPQGFLSYTPYDNAMFLANLTLVPVLAAFLFSVETGFFEHYLRFYRDIRSHGTLDKIEKNHKAVVGVVLRDTRNLLVMQGSIGLLAILLAPRIFEYLGVGFLGVGIFRFGVLGSTFLAFVMFTSILLYYFDARRRALLINAVFLLSNALLTWLSRDLGFSYYGYGFLLSSFLSFIVGVVVCAEYIMQLPYHTFISQNTSVRMKGEGTLPRKGSESDDGFIWLKG